ncbi:MAG: DUF2318 domain-containing protein [Lachnospiraceae bacterium]|nr:DUF2318 domain-containing protein [Lachnospiraceae bacterium]
MKNRKESKGNRALVLVALIIVIVCMVVVMFANRNKKTQPSNSTQTVQKSKKETDDGTMIEKGDPLVIPVSEITTDVSFFPIVVDRTAMEVIAVKDNDGNIRTAFNTCQVCYSSGRGYYEQEGDMLVCQNCGNQFTIEQIEIESGGCNPWPIFENDKAITDDSIEISYDFLTASKEIFENWKVND